MDNKLIISIQENKCVIRMNLNPENNKHNNVSIIIIQGIIIIVNIES